MAVAVAVMMKMAVMVTVGIRVWIRFVFFIRYRSNLKVFVFYSLMFLEQNLFAEI